MDFFYDIFRYEYLMNALLAAVFAGITCGIVGTYVVARRMVFLCGGVTHASFGGLGIAVYMGANPIAGAMVFAVLSALGIEWAGDRGRIREDSAIGIIWSVGMAVGALFMSLTPGYTSGDLSSYMFGSIVTVTTRDVATLGVLTLFCIVGAVLWWRPVMYLAFDRDFAASQGIATRAASYIMAVIVALTIVLSIRVMGIVLLLSLFTIPAVTANAMTKSYAAITRWAAVLAVAGAVVGLFISYNLEVPPGASIIFTLTIALIVVKLLTLRVPGAAVFRVPQDAEHFHQLLSRIRRLRFPVQHRLHLPCKRYCKLYRTFCGFASKSRNFPAFFKVFCAFHKNRTASFGGTPPCCGHLLRAGCCLQLRAALVAEQRIVRDGRTALRAALVCLGGRGLRLLGGHILVDDIVHLSSFGRGQACLQAGDLLLDAVDHFDVFIHQRLVFFLALGQAVHQCAQLTLCLEQLALFADDQRLGLALLGQIQRSVLALFGVFQTHFLDLVEIHKRHLSYCDLRRPRFAKQHACGVLLTSVPWMLFSL